MKVETVLSGVHRPVRVSGFRDLTYIIFLLNTYPQTYERVINIFLLNRVCYYRGGYSKGKIHQRKIEKMERALVEKINPHWSDLAWVVASL